MEVILRIVAGPQRGRRLVFAESDNLIVGREDPTSQAHLNLSADDLYVSRHHFSIEVRPPNCLIRDHHSANGTFVRRVDGEDWTRVEETRIYHNDQIKVGHTILKVHVNRPRPVIVATQTFDSAQRTAPQLASSVGTPTVRESSSAPACLHCGKELAATPAVSGSMRDLDFMCPPCRAQVKEQRGAAATARSGVPYHCARCHCQVSGQADADGRAAELGDVALYWCKACADSGRQLSGQSRGGYVLQRELGKGGMGIVFLGWQAQTGRLAALKQMLPIAGADDEQHLRFLREASIMGEIAHPGVARLYEAGREGDSPFVVCEYVPDGNLKQFVGYNGRPRLAPVEAARMIADCLVGLNDLHQRGLVHRDLKPENILLRKDNGILIPKLVDFGLARSYEKHGGTITRTGAAAGTIMYMPREQIVSFKKSGPSVDIYAMGVILYYLLTGYYPLDFPPSWMPVRKMRKDPVRMILEDAPHPVAARNSAIPPDLAKAVDKAVAPEARDRFTTAEELRRAVLASAG